LTDERVFQATHIRNVLSLMLSCGMYDYSGEWSYIVGLPAKSGVSGTIMVVVPNIGGFALYSPPLDELGNSVRGVEFCKRLVGRFSFHYYDMLNGIVSSSSNKKNPTLARNRLEQNDLVTLCYLCARGDLVGIRGMVALGANLNGQDYDGRSPLHLASSEGQLAVVKYLVSRGVNLNCVDRWGGTPLADAVREDRKQVAAFLQSRGAVVSSQLSSKGESSHFKFSHSIWGKNTPVGIERSTSQVSPLPISVTPIPLSSSVTSPPLLVTTIPTAATTAVGGGGGTGSSSTGSTTSSTVSALSSKRSTTPISDTLSRPNNVTAATTMASISVTATDHVLSRTSTNATTAIPQGTSPAARPSPTRSRQGSNGLSTSVM